MKTKTIRVLLITVAFFFSLAFSVKIIKSKYADLRIEFLKSAKGQTQHFINSFIN